eukprot:scaffold90_cov264-Pinguiococcus_pyrenoidosus.AAC.20
MVSITGRRPCSQRGHGLHLLGLFLLHALSPAPRRRSPNVSRRIFALLAATAAATLFASQPQPSLQHPDGRIRRKLPILIAFLIFEAAVTPAKSRGASLPETSPSEQQPITGVLSARGLQRANVPLWPPFPSQWGRNHRLCKGPRCRRRRRRFASCRLRPSRQGWADLALRTR